MHHVAVKFSAITFRGAASDDATVHPMAVTAITVYTNFIINSLLIIHHPIQGLDLVPKGRLTTHSPIQAKSRRHKNYKHL